MHLLHNEPDPLCYLYPRADQLPDLVQHVPLRQSVEQRRDVHGRQSCAVHLLHNKPDPLRYLYHRADQLPDLVQHVPLRRQAAPLASATLASATFALAPAALKSEVHQYVLLRQSRHLR